MSSFHLRALQLQLQLQLLQLLWCYRYCNGRQICLEVFPTFSFTVLFGCSSTDSVILSLLEGTFFPTGKSYNPTHCFFLCLFCFVLVSVLGKSRPRGICGAKTSQGK